MTPEKKWVLNVLKAGKVVGTKEFKACDEPDYVAGYCQALIDKGYDISLVESIPSKYQYGFVIN